MVCDICLLCELYLSSLKILIFVPFKINKFIKKKKNQPQNPADTGLTPGGRTETPQRGPDAAARAYVLQ